MKMPAAKATFLFLFSISSAGASTALDRSIEEFMIDQGCAFGPTTRNAAVSANIDPSVIDHLKADAVKDTRTVKTGDWLVLPTEVCKLRPPNVSSEISLKDPEVLQNISPPQQYEKDGFQGCFLNGDGLLQSLRLSRGWPSAKLNEEFLKFLSRGLSSGDLYFFSPDPLRTPPGVGIMNAECVKGYQAQEIQRSHELLIKHFDALIRADAAGEAVCEMSGFPSWKFDEISQRVLGEKALNAWMGFEISFIARGAGWYEGQTDSQKGRARPPLCHYGSN